MKTILVAVALLATAVIAEAQQAKRVFRIGFISPSSSSTAANNLQAFQDGLRDRGYIAGQNIALEIRWAEGSTERFHQLLAELIQLKMNVLVVGGAAGALAAKNAGDGITPVVFAAVTDPLGYGLIDNLAHPGGNITGVALALGEGFSGKWIELLKAAVPKIIRVAILQNPDHPLADVFRRETQAAGQAHNTKLDFFKARDVGELGSAITHMERQRVRGLIVTPSPLFSSQQNRLVEFVTRGRWPSMFFSKDFVDAGGLMSYGPSFSDSYYRAATYVDKILKGTKPADLPVEQPMKFELVINLKTAKQIGIEIPQWTLMKADRVIR